MKYLRIYDNLGRSFDRITVVFTRKRFDGQFMHVAASETGSGFYQHGYSDQHIDRPKYSHLGKKIKFYDLHPDLQTRIKEEYEEIWGKSKT